MLCFATVLKVKPLWKTGNFFGKINAKHHRVRAQNLETILLFEDFPKAFYSKHSGNLHKILPAYEPPKKMLQL